MKLSVFILAYFLRGTSCLFSVPPASEDDALNVEDDCISLGTFEKPAHIGWPFHFTCDDIITPAKLADIETYKKYRTIPAEVTSFNPNGTIAWKFDDTTVNLRYDPLPYPTFDVLESMNDPFEMEYKIPEIDYCRRITYYLQLEKVPDNTTCSYPETQLSMWYGTIGNSFTFLCHVPYGVFPKLYANTDDYEYEWWYNCTKSYPDSTVIRGNQLTVNDITYSAGGEYTCAVKYNNQKRLILKEDFCVKTGTSGSYSIKCANHVNGCEGEDLEVTCTVDFDDSDVFYYDYNMAWFKKTSGNTLEEICSAIPRQGIVNSTSDGQRVQCENVKIMPDQNCFRYQPAKSEEKSAHLAFQLKMMIKDLTLNDAAQYTVQFHVYGNSSESRSVDVNVNRLGSLPLHRNGHGHRNRKISLLNV